MIVHAMSVSERVIGHRGEPQAAGDEQFIPVPFPPVPSLVRERKNGDCQEQQDKGDGTEELGRRSVKRNRRTPLFDMVRLIRRRCRRRMPQH